MSHSATVEQAWLEYRKKLLLFICAKVDSTEDAEDILSDVFSKLLNTSVNNEPPRNLGAWLYYVTKNRIIDYYRAKKPLEQLPEDLAEEHEDIDTIAALSKCMLPMIRALPENYRQALILSEIEGKKYKDVAVELNLTLSAVKSRVLRGRALLHGSILSCCRIDCDSTGKVVKHESNSGNSCSDCSE